jgi:hypothetical protein
VKFSNEAYSYLNKLSRDSDFIITDSQIVIDYLTNQGIQPFDKVVEFQLDYSGLELTIANKQNSAFSAHLFSKGDIKENRAIDRIEIDGELYFHCGDHNTAQFWFVIGSNGQICTYNNNEGTVNIICSSFDKFIETYAFKDLLRKGSKYEYPYFYDLLDNTAFNIFTSKYFLHEAASDQYTVWLSDLENDLIIQKGTWYDRPKSFIHIYGSNHDKCKIFIELLKAKKIIE